MTRVSLSRARARQAFCESGIIGFWRQTRLDLPIGWRLLKPRHPYLFSYLSSYEAFCLRNLCHGKKNQDDETTYLPIYLC